MKREEDIEKILQNSSHGKPKWYVIFNRPFRGIYTDWATASTHIIRKSVSHKSYLTKKATEKALEESYKTIATEEVQKSKQFVSLKQHLQSQTAKLNAFNKMKNIPTAKEKEEMRRPTIENFQRLLDSLMNYNEVHATMLFYPKKRRNIGPKAVFIPEASPKDVYDYYVHGLVDTVYINGETLKELQEFPPKVQSIIKGYKEIFARGRELFLKMRSSYPIFDKEQKLLVPSITVAQLGVSNKDYPDKDEKIECSPPSIDDLVYSFMEERINEVQLKVLSNFEDQIEHGTLAQRGTLLWHAHIMWLRATVRGAIVILLKLGVPYPFPKPHMEQVVILDMSRNDGLDMIRLKSLPRWWNHRKLLDGSYPTAH
ncbi:hypothetical protein Tco_0644694 [Tanacetum coccineum]